MLLEQLLFAPDIDVEFGIGLIEIVEGDAVERPHRVYQSAVDARFLERGVGKEDQDRVAHVDVSVIEECEGDGSRFATAC